MMASTMLRGEHILVVIINTKQLTLYNPLRRVSVVYEEKDMSNLGVTKAVYEYIESTVKCEAYTREINHHFKGVYTRDAIRRCLKRLYWEGYLYKVEQSPAVILWKLNTREYKYHE